MRPVSHDDQPRPVGARRRSERSLQRVRREYGRGLLRERHVRALARVEQAGTVSGCRSPTPVSEVGFSPRGRLLRHLPRCLEPGGGRPGAQQRSAADRGPGDQQRNTGLRRQHESGVQQLPVPVRDRRAHLQRVQVGGDRRHARGGLPVAAGGSAGWRATGGLRERSERRHRRQLRGRHHSLLHLPDLPHAARGRPRLQQTRGAAAQGSAAP